MVRKLSDENYTPDSVTDQVFAGLSPKLLAKLQENADKLSRETGANHIHKIADRLNNVGK